MKTTVALLASIALVGCAAQPHNVVPTQVGYGPYRAMSCEDLARDLRQAEGRIDTLTAQQRKSANADVALFTVGMVLFWPALFGLLATDDHETELARAKGERSAMTIVQSEKCPISAADQ